MLLQENKTGGPTLLSLQDRLRATYACTANNVGTSLVEGRPVTFIIDEISVESDLSQTEDVDLVLLCFNIMSPPSLHNLYLHWLPRLSSLTTSSHLLVGCQADLRRDKAGLASLARTGSQPVSSNLALSFCRRMERMSCGPLSSSSSLSSPLFPWRTLDLE